MRTRASVCLISVVTACSAGGDGSGLGSDSGGAPGSTGGASAAGSTTSGGASAAGGASTGGAMGGGPGTGGSGTIGSGGMLAAGGAVGGGLATGGAVQMGLPPGVTSLFPPPNGTGLCPDPPLRLTFRGPPTLGASGKIRVLSASGGVVATVDMAAGNVTDTIGGTAFTLVRPVFIDGNDVVVSLKRKALAYGQTYDVTVDPGAILAPGGGAFSIDGDTSWRFSTAPSGPATLSTLSVAVDGSGQFCSVEGATDALPAGSTEPAFITIGRGRYHEIVHLSGKSNVTLHGEDRKQTVVLGTNNHTLNPSTATRALMGFDRTNGLVVENLTIHNLTPQGGSQAEALRLQNCDRCVVRDVDILSLQDTLLWSGRVYAKNCYVEGNVDYVWGTGAVYFDSCEFHTVGRPGVIVQARNAPGAYGYVFVDSKLTADAAATSNILARIDAAAYPGSHVAFIDCQMSGVAAAGFTITAGSSTSALRFWEYGSNSAAGNPLDMSGRVNGSSRISSAEAAKMRDPSVVLGGWAPPR